MQNIFNDKKLISCNEIGVQRIAGGDPYYEEGYTLKTRLTNLEFYLAPSNTDLTREQRDFLDEHHFAKEDQALNTSLGKIEDFAENNGVLGIRSA